MGLVLQRSPTDLHVCIDVLDEIGIGGGASGVAGGLLHPYSPKGYILFPLMHILNKIYCFIIIFFYVYLQLNLFGWQPSVGKRL